MKIKIDIRPQQITARTMAEVRRAITKITLNGFCYSKYGRTTDQNKVVGIVYEKRRRKVGAKTTKSFGGEKKKVYKEISRGYWIAYVYMFPTEILDAMNVKEIKQNKRNFTFVRR